MTINIHTRDGKIFTFLAASWDEGKDCMYFRDSDGKLVRLFPICNILAMELR